MMKFKKKISVQILAPTIKVRPKVTTKEVAKK